MKILLILVVRKAVLLRMGYLCFVENDLPLLPAKVISPINLKTTFPQNSNWISKSFID